MLSKERILALAGMAAFGVMGNPAKALDVDVDVNVGGPVIVERNHWAPLRTYHHRVAYRYYPDCGVYYYADDDLYYYLLDGEWVVSEYLPDFIRGCLGTYVYIDLDGYDPRYYDHVIVKRYPRRYTIRPTRIVYERPTYVYREYPRDYRFRYNRDNPYRWDSHDRYDNDWDNDRRSDGDRRTARNQTVIQRDRRSVQTDRNIRTDTSRRVIGTDEGRRTIRNDEDNDFRTNRTRVERPATIQRSSERPASQASKERAVQKPKESSIETHGSSNRDKSNERGNANRGGGDRGRADQGRGGGERGGGASKH